MFEGHMDSPFVINFMSPTYTTPILPGEFIKGFPIDDTKIEAAFAGRVGKEKMRLVRHTLIASGKEDGFELVVGKRTGHTRDCPFVLVLASGLNRKTLEAMEIENAWEKAGWVGQFLEEKLDVFERY
ncbi:hypothetical protein APHAL10511_000582 [Amanita phalloides]|nr:hypothetical protein APHAL10511_000582 [Amanita phalloides]